MKSSLIVGGLLSLALSAPVNDNSLSAHPHLFVFGDSYTATCFNTSSTLPTLDNPLGNPTPGTCTSANGLVWPEWLTLKFNTTKIVTYDFAVSGASITDSFDQQVQFAYEPQFAALRGNKKKGWTSANAIFASWVGINDINWQSILFSADHTSNFRKTFPPRMDLYFQLMDSLYNTGARNFLFVNMPPLARAPMITMHGKAVVDNYNEGVSLFNDELLPQYVDKFTASHKGTKTRIYDAHKLFNKVLDSPHAYGYRNAHCFNETGCFWANNYHPVDTMHQRLASEMVPLLRELGWPEFHWPE